MTSMQPAPKSQQSRPSPWLARYRANPSAARRVVCFPHAGGSASFYRPWAQHLGPTYELLAVQYPGRENRYAEPLIPALDEIAAAAAHALLAEPVRETVLFGHSMGAAVAYETLRILEAEGATHFTRLCVSGRRITDFSEEIDPVPRTDDELITAMTGLGGTQTEVLHEPDLREMFLPIIRNDYHLIDTYRPPRDATPIRADVIALLGDNDPQVDRRQATEWASVTAGTFASHVFPGGHFYLMDHAQQVIELITGDFSA
ncbi:thioesterase II family protein [Streptomyces cyaneus]|uniref:thioesterase II family protein n=1 Tax=Streptomyces cyaneus TaxID=1904 RepID=UPI001FE5AC2C|nr:alpha/beta fold hydrolase [Streptomyces cyaneus]